MPEYAYSEALGQARDLPAPSTRPTPLPSNPRRRSGLEHSVAAIAGVLESRDSPIVQHQRRVGALAWAIAVELGLPAKRARGIRLAGLVHDLGEIRIPPGQSSNTGGLTDEEVVGEQEHPQMGHDILKYVGFPWPIAEIVLQHHERIDGSGSPRGLKRGEILLGARIIAVADIIEVMAFEQDPRRPGSGISAALAEVEAREGRYYDAAVVEAALRLFREKGFSF